MRLLTWLDVRRHYERIRQEQIAFSYPDPIVRMEFFMSSVDVTVKSGLQATALQWMKEQAPGWIEGDCFKLQSGDLLPIYFTDEEDAIISEPHFHPLWRDAALLPPNASGSSRQFACLGEPWQEPEPHLAAFFSFKGGVSRTTHMLACLAALKAGLNTTPLRVLLIDADVEAPGFSYWEDQGEDRVSYISFLELIHSTEEAHLDASIKYFADELRKTECIEGNVSWCVLPAFSSESELLDWPIKPEHIVESPEGSWTLATRIRQLGHALGANLILVDLRAGLSEISSALLFDARIERFLVSSLNQQSLSGIKMILGLLAKFAPNQDQRQMGYSDPTVILSMIHHEVVGSPYHDDAIASLVEAYAVESETASLDVVSTEFAQELLHLKDWKDYFERVPGTNLFKEMQGIAELWLPKNPVIVPHEHLAGKAAKLSELCKNLIYAEHAPGGELLITGSLRAVALDHLNTLPNIVIMGSKGAGKTYTFIQMSHQQTWTQFCTVAGDKPNHQTPINFFPFLEGKYLSDTAREIAAKARRACTPDAHWQVGATRARLTELTQSQKGLEMTDLDWELFWLEEISSALGLSPVSTPFALHEAVIRQQRRIVVLIDGLEDALEELTVNHVPQRALRALLALPSKLRQIRDVAIGLIIFIRRDLAALAITQNFGQFSHQYRRYELRWDFREMLQLVCWLGIKAEVLSLHTDEMVQKSLAELDQLLLPIWGERMGATGSREARTSVWIYGALVDYNGNLQARDLVRLLAEASTTPKNSDPQRILSPSDIKNALPKCSREKVEEAIQEFPFLGKISKSFERAQADKRVPFMRKDFQLEHDEWIFLQSNGIVTEVNGEYHMPEIYRFGLGFELTKKARPRVTAFVKKLLGSMLKELNH